MTSVICDIVEVQRDTPEVEADPAGRSAVVETISELPFRVHPESPDKLPINGPYFWFDATYNDYVVRVGAQWFRAYRCEPV